MNKKEAGILVRRIFVPESCRPIPLYLDGPLDCEWVGIMMYADSSEIELVFYDISGEPREWLFRDSMKIAIDEVRNITACEKLEWQECHIKSFTDDRVINWRQVSKLKPVF